MTTEREKSPDRHTVSAARWLRPRGLRWPRFSGVRRSSVNAQAESNVVEVIDLVDGARSSATYVGALGRRGLRRGIFLTNQHVVSPDPPDIRSLQLKLKGVERPCKVLPRPDGVKADVALLTVDEAALVAFEGAGLEPARLNFLLQFEESIFLAGFTAGVRPHVIDGKLPSIPQALPVRQLDGECFVNVEPGDPVEPGMSGGAVYGSTSFRNSLNRYLQIPMMWDVFAIIGGKLTSDVERRGDGNVEVFAPRGLSIPLSAFADAFPDTVGKLRARWNRRWWAKTLCPPAALALLVTASVALAWSASRPAVPKSPPSPPPAPVRVDERHGLTLMDAALTVDPVVPKGAFADVSGGANLPDGTRLVVETTPAGALLDGEFDNWAASGDAVVKAHRWRVEGVSLRKPNHAAGEIKLRVALAPEGRTDLAPAAIYSTAVNVSVPEPRVWITRINGQPVSEGVKPVITPDTKVRVSGGAENLMPGDTIWVMIYGKAPEGVEDMWPRTGAETDSHAPYRSGSMNWTRQVYIDTSKDGWTTFTVRAGACSEPPIGNKGLFEEAGSGAVTCTGRKR